MKLRKIKYADLNNKQKEIFNFQKVAGELSDYGYNCIKLADDWQGADFLAYHKDGSNTLKVQLKSRVTISKQYVGKGLYMAFPINQEWCLIEHDALVKLIGKHTDWLETKSWQEDGKYHSAKPNQHLLKALSGSRL